jgi:hypothetical protein
MVTDLLKQMSAVSGTDFLETGVFFAAYTKLPLSKEVEEIERDQ